MNAAVADAPQLTSMPRIGELITRPPESTAMDWVSEGVGSDIPTRVLQSRCPDSVNRSIMGVPGMGDPGWTPAADVEPAQPATNTPPERPIATPVAVSKNRVGVEGGSTSARQRGCSVRENPRIQPVVARVVAAADARPGHDDEVAAHRDVLRKLVDRAGPAGGDVLPPERAARGIRADEPPAALALALDDAEQIDGAVVGDGHGDPSGGRLGNRQPEPFPLSLPAGRELLDGGGGRDLVAPEPRRVDRTVGRDRRVGDRAALAHVPLHADGARIGRKAHDKYRSQQRHRQRPAERAPRWVHHAEA